MEDGNKTDPTTDPVAGGASGDTATKDHQAELAALTDKWKRALAEAEARAYSERVKAAEVLEKHPALLRMAELETLRQLAANANARLYLGFDRNGLALDGAEAKQVGS